MTEAFLIYQAIVSAITVGNIEMALTLLQDLQNQDTLFFERAEGILMHAKVLYYAIKADSFDLINKLLNINVRSDIAFYKNFGNTPIGFAFEKGKESLLPLLLLKTDTTFAFHAAFKSKKDKIMEFLIEKKAVKQRLLSFLKKKGMIKSSNE